MKNGFGAKFLIIYIHLTVHQVPAVMGFFKVYYRIVTSLSFKKVRKLALLSENNHRQG